MSRSFRIVAVLLLYGIVVNTGISMSSLGIADDEGDTDDVDVWETNDDGHHDENLPIILWWDGIGTLENNVQTCDSGRKCTVSYDRSLLHKQEVMMYAFYGTRFLENGLPLPRQPGDLWALMHEGAPQNNDWLFSFESTVELFNYTSTFKRESDFPLTTHRLSNTDALVSDKYLIETAEKNTLRKGGLAPVVFISNDCYSNPNRERYVKVLQEHIDIDSYGSCLKNKEYPNEYSHLTNNSALWSEDYFKFIAQYKFVISFENAICDDYITEKLWRPLEAGCVPIATGSPTLKDFLPSDKSAILTQDFDSVKELAEFIKKLDEDDDQYDEYLEFKRNGISNARLRKEIKRMTPNGVDQSFMTALHGYQCMLCDKLHDATQAVKSGKPVPRSQATSDHFGCPLPTHKLDEDGESYIPDVNRQIEVRFYKSKAKVLRSFYDKGEDVTSSELNRHAIDILNTEVNEEHNEAKEEL